MKTNLPVTDHEVLLSDEDAIVSKTDLKGIITYANQDFCRISGFSLNELIGSNHNLVRHPDMPPEAFADLWATIKDGKPWSGLVKNRCKNGDYYWVRAEAAPIEENGKIVGYASFRAKPGRSEVAQAEQLYRQIKQGTAKVRLIGGYVVSTRLLDRLSPLRWLNSLRIASQLWLLIGIFLVALAFTAISQMVVSKPLAVGGETYTHITDDNDLLADALPPPLYLVESYLTALRMLELEASALPPLLDAGKKLDADMESRHKYWQGRLQREELKALEGKDYQSGKAFLETLQREFIPALQQGDRELARKLLPQLEQRYDAHRSAVDALVAATIKDKQEVEADTKAYVSLSSNVMLAITAALLIILAGLSWTVLRNVMRFGDPQYVSDIIRQIASGNLAIFIKDSGDPRSMLAVVQYLKSGLRKLVGVAAHNAERVRGDSHRVAAAATQVTASTQAQSDSISTIAATAEEMTTSVTHVAAESSEAHAISMQSSDACVQGAEVIREAVQSMEQIAVTVREAASSITSLGEQSEKISSVVSVIREIADQTNLLALNAAIEAARAGEQGRGFAVVADAVRQLAERTTKATQEIAGMITSIQDGMQSAVHNMENGVRQVDHGVRLAGHAGDAINHIRESAVQVSQVVSAISSALQAQQAASQDVAQHIEKIAAMAEENSATTVESQRIATNVGQSAEALQGAVTRFVV